MSRRLTSFLMALLLVILALLSVLALSVEGEREALQKRQVELLERLDTANQTIVDESLRNARLLACMEVHPDSEPVETTRQCLERVGFDSSFLEEFDRVVSRVEGDS